MSETDRQYGTDGEYVESGDGGMTAARQAPFSAARSALWMS